MRLWFNTRQRMDGLELLRDLRDREVAAAFFDPQYRDNLDRLQLGNEHERQQGRFALPAMATSEIYAFIAEITRALRPSGHLFLWMDKYTLSSGAWTRWFAELPPTREVDMIVWDKGRTGMGYRARSRTEFLLVVQKGPRSTLVWKDRGIPDCWREVTPRGGAHPHTKPRGLIERLILSTTSPRDVVVDPAAGSYQVLAACLATGRRFIGCDVVGPEHRPDAVLPKAARGRLGGRAKSAS